MSHIEQQSSTRERSLAHLSPQLQSVLEAGAAGVGAYGLKKGAEMLIRGTIPAANIAIPVAIGAIGGAKEVLVGIRQEKHIGTAAACKNLWEKHNGAIGRVINFPERVVSRAVITPEKKIQLGLELEDPEKSYVVLRQTQLLTGDFRHLDKNLTSEAKSRLEELNSQLSPDQIIELNKTAEKAAHETYQRTVLATAAANGLKLGLISLVGLNLSEEHVQHLIDQISQSETAKVLLGKIQSAVHSIQEYVANNDKLETLRHDVTNLKDQLSTATESVRQQTESITNQISQIDHQITDQQLSLDTHVAETTNLQDQITQLEATRAAIKEPVIQRVTEFVSAKPASMEAVQYGDGYLRIAELSSRYLGNNGVWPTLSTAANEIADNHPDLFIEGRRIANSLVDASGQGPIQAIDTLQTFDRLGIILPGGGIDTAAVHKITNLALSGDQQARKDLFALMRWFNSNSNIPIPKEVIRTASVLEQQQAIDLQLNTLRTALSTTQSETTQIKETLSLLDNTRRELVVQLSGIQVDQNIAQQILATEGQIANLETANNATQLELNQLLPELIGESFDPNQATAQLEKLQQLTSTLESTTTVSAADQIQEFTRAETIATLVLLGGAGVTNQIATSHPDTRIYRAQFDPEYIETDLFADVQITPLSSN